ncbi:MAG: hypothetical protein WCD11_27245 [Solirubrobacteraceae bacterium]
MCDLGGGVVISTEIEPEKARLAKENLAAAGLADVVDLRLGDALETLRDVPLDAGVVVSVRAAPQSIRSN